MIPAHRESFIELDSALHHYFRKHRRWSGKVNKIFYWFCERLELPRCRKGIRESLLVTSGKFFVCRHRLGMGWTNVPPISKYFSEIFIPSHIKFTNNNSNKDFKSVKRPYEVEKFKWDRKILSSWKIKKVGARNSNAWPNSYWSQILSTRPQELV